MFSLISHMITSAPYSSSLNPKTTFFTMSFASIRPIPLAEPVIRTFFPLRWTTFRRRTRRATHKITTAMRIHSADTITIINYDVTRMTTQSKCPPIRLRDCHFFVFSWNEGIQAIRRAATCLWCFGFTPLRSIHHGYHVLKLLPMSVHSRAHIR